MKKEKGLLIKSYSSHSEIDDALSAIEVLLRATTSVQKVLGEMIQKKTFGLSAGSTTLKDTLSVLKDLQSNTHKPLENSKDEDMKVLMEKLRR